MDRQANLVKNHALRWLSMGFPIILANGKKPRGGKAWGKIQYTPDKVKAELAEKPALNLGLMLGCPGGDMAPLGLLDLECDNDQAVKDYLDLFNGSPPVTAAFQSRKGVHYLFQADQHLLNLGRAVFKYGQLEVRIGGPDKQTQTIFPPSTANGFTREWIAKPSDVGITALTSEQVDRLIAKAGSRSAKPVRATVSARVMPSTIDHFNTDGPSIADMITAAGWDFDHSDQTYNYYRRPGKEDDGHSATIARRGAEGAEVLYVFSSEAPPFEPDRGYDRFAVYTLLQHGGDQDAAIRAARGAGNGEQVSDVQKATADATGSNSRPQISSAVADDDEAMEVAPWEPFPIDVLPESIRDYIGDCSIALPCDPAFVAGPLLAGLAGAIGNSVAVQITPTWAEPSLLWVMVVARTGSMKTPSFDCVTTFFDDRQEGLSLQHTVDMDRHENAMHAYDIELKLYKAGKGPLPLKPDEPTEDRIWISDVTYEALATILDSNPRGVLAMHDELAGWFNALSRYQGGAISHDSDWCKIHSTKAISIDRKTGVKHIYIRRPNVSIAGGIQPRVLEKALTHERYAAGVAARFLVLSPPEDVDGFPALIEKQSEERIGEIFKLLWEIQQFHRPVYLEFDPAGQRMYEAWHEGIRAEMRAEPDDHLRGVVSKARAAAARLALILHLVQQAENEGQAQQRQIGAEHVSAGCQLADWFIREWRRVYAKLTAVGEQSDADGLRKKVLALIRRKGGKITPSELRRSSRAFTDATSAELYLRELAAEGFGTFKDEPTGKPGKVPTVFTLTV